MICKIQNFVRDKLPVAGNVCNLKVSLKQTSLIPGSHQDVKNLYYWQVGCMGMTSPCSSVSIFIVMTDLSAWTKLFLY